MFVANEVKRIKLSRRNFWSISANLTQTLSLSSSSSCHRANAHLFIYRLFIVWRKQQLQKGTLDERNDSLWLGNKCTNYVSVCVVWVGGVCRSVACMQKRFMAWVESYLKNYRLATPKVWCEKCLCSRFSSNWKLYSPACPQTPHMIDWFPLSSKYWHIASSARRLRSQLGLST